MKNYPFQYFSVLSCLFGWSLFIAAALGANINPNGMPLGPIVAAAIVAIGGGKEKRKEWWNSLITLRTSVSWYVLAIVCPFLIVLLAVGINHLFGAPFPEFKQMLPDTNFGIRLILMFVLVGIGEEAGWTAFMAPRLLKRKNTLAAATLLAIVRVTWHIPLIMAVGGSYWLESVLGIVAFQFLAIWLLRRSGQVWILIAIWHGVHNTASQHFGPMVQGLDHDRLGLLKAALYLIVATSIYLIDIKFLQSEKVCAESLAMN